MAGGSVRVSITDDTDKLRRIGVHLRKLHAKNALVVRAQLRKGLRDAAKSTIQWQRRWVRKVAGAPTEWRQVASRRTNVQTRLGKKTAGIAIRVGRTKEGGPYARYLNRGKWRRPRRDHRERPWIEQRVQPGWFDRPAEASEAKFHAAVQTVINDVIRDFKIE